MIVQWLIDAIVGILSAAFDLLPTSSIGYFSSSAYTGLTSTIGDAIGKWDSLTHSIAMIEITGIVLGILLPTVLLYKVLNWVYKHIPQIAGFGPGSG